MIFNRIARACREDENSTLNNLGDHARRARELELRRQKALQFLMLNLSKNAQFEKKNALNKFIQNKDYMNDQDRLARLAAENRAKALRRLMNNFNKGIAMDQMNVVNRLKRFNQDRKNYDKRARNWVGWVWSRIKGRDANAKKDCYKAMVDYAMKQKGVTLREGLIKNRLITMFNSKQTQRASDALRNLVKWNQEQGQREQRRMNAANIICRGLARASASKQSQAYHRCYENYVRRKDAESLNRTIVESQAFLRAKMRKKLFNKFFSAQQSKKVDGLNRLRQNRRDLILEDQKKHRLIKKLVHAQN